jgi:hypothetical protein
MERRDIERFLTGGRAQLIAFARVAVNVVTFVSELEFCHRISLLIYPLKSQCTLDGKESFAR